MAVSPSILHLKSGSLLDITPRAPGPLSISGESPESLEKRTILIHAGSFQSVDGPIEFDAKRIMRIVDHQNSAIQSLAKGYGSIEQMPLGAFPPILEDHDEETSKVVGRLSGLLEYVEMNIPGVGTQVPAALGKIVFLGQENTRRVLDGRIYHVSIGINEQTDTLSEASVVVTPAAPGAMLLSRANSTHLSSPPQKKKGTSLMPQSSIQKTSLTAERNKRLHSLRQQMQKLTSQIHTGREVMRLKAKEAGLVHRLKSAVSGGKMTPAEYRKLLKDGDLSRLAGLPDEACDLFVKAYESREPVLEPGQRGSLQALEGGQVAKEIGQKRLKAEIKADIVAGGNIKRLKKLEDEPSSQEDIAQHRAKRFSELTDEKQPRSDQDSEYPPQTGLEAVDGEPPFADYQKKMSEMEEHIAQLQTVCAKLVDEMNLMTNDESEDEHDLAGDEGKSGADSQEKEPPPPAKPNSEEKPKDGPPKSDQKPVPEKEPEKKE